MGLKVLAATMAALALVRPAGAREAAPLTSSTLGRVALTWTAPGDDHHVGRAAAYDLRYSIYPIDENTFPVATPVFGLATPQLAGEEEFFTVGGLLPGTLYYFAVKSVDEAGNWSAMSNVVQEMSIATVSTGEGAVPLDFSKPYPNPTRWPTRFELSLPGDMHVQIEVYDVSGRRVRTLHQGSAGAGRRTIEWDLEDAEGRRVRPGLYVVTARLGDRWITRRVVITR